MTRLSKRSAEASAALCIADSQVADAIDRQKFRASVFRRESNYDVHFTGRDGFEQVRIGVPRSEVLKFMKAVGKPLPGGSPAILEFATRLLPVSERGEWLEEQRGYLADLPTRQKRWAWILAQLVAMPRFAHTVRTGRQKEPA